MSMNKQIFAERLRSARKIAMLSQDELATKLNNEISKQAISKYEKAEMLPSSTILIKLARALRVKPDYFFRKNTVELQNIEFRKRSTTSAKFEEYIKELSVDFLERYIEIETILKLNKEFINPIRNRFVHGQTDIETASEELRKAWKLGLDPLGNIIELFENHGIKVFEIDEDEQFDGLSATFNGNILIVLNKRHLDPLRKRFTAIHELAHLILEFEETISQKEKEIFCHNFAGALLMPSETFKREFGGIRTQFTIFELINLAIYFGASIQAVMKRAHVLGLINDLHYKFFNIEWNKRGYKKEEPIKPEIKNKFIEIPQRIKQLVSRAVAESIISINKAAALLNKKSSELQDELEFI